jgi:hypothetical protein
MRMSETKGERRAKQQRKDRFGMQTTGKYFWHAIANSRVKRDKARAARLERQASATDEKSRAGS